MEDCDGQDDDGYVGLYLADDEDSLAREALLAEIDNEISSYEDDLASIDDVSDSDIKPTLGSATALVGSDPHDPGFFSRNPNHAAYTRVDWPDNIAEVDGDSVSIGGRLNIIIVFKPGVDPASMGPDD